MKKIFKKIKNIFEDIKIRILIKKWEIEDRKYRKNRKLTDPNVGCGLYGVSCYKCPRNTRCWL